MTTWRELTFPVDSLQNDLLTIEDDRAGIITDPLRWRILEILGAGKSIEEISEKLDVTDARVLYHVKRLAETGVVILKETGEDVEEDDAAAGTGELRCLPAAGTIRVRVDHRPADQTEAGANQMGQEEAIPADVADQFNQAFREAAEGMYGSTFQTSVNHNRARLSEVQAAEFNHRLLALIEEYFPPGKGDSAGIKYGFYGVLAPIDLHPLGDTDSDE